MTQGGSCIKERERIEPKDRYDMWAIAVGESSNFLYYLSHLKTVPLGLVI
jgi:hypothetical protein